MEGRQNLRVVPRFTFKRFVRAAETLKPPGGATTTTAQPPCPATGREVQQFYEEIISQPEVKVKTKLESNDNKTAVKNEIVDDDDDDDDVVIVDDAKLDGELVRAVESGSLATVQRLVGQGASLRQVDTYGWTLLMVAAARGATLPLGGGGGDVVQFLLERGADRAARDKAGNTAADIARVKGHFQIEAFIIGWKEGEATGGRRGKGDCFDVCDVCDAVFDSREKSSHLGSVPHQLAVDRSRLEQVNPGFGISQTNRGFQLLKKSGWDGYTGLGEAGKEGRLFPIKSVLKTDRKGLDVGDRSSARVTHFGAKDARGVVTVDRREKRTAIRQFKSDLVRQSAKEQRLRQDLAQL